MQKLNLPSFDFHIRTAEGKYQIFDVIRKKYINLTDEEWVRQHFLHYLINHLGYPRSLIALESGLKYNKLSKRADIIVYDRSGAPFMLVECKAPSVKLSQQTFFQASCYNHTFKAAYLAVTNGLSHYCCAIDHREKKARFLNDIPGYEEGR